jgi:hypothetical protein
MEQPAINKQKAQFYSLNRMSVWVSGIFIVSALLLIIGGISEYSESELLRRVIGGASISQLEAEAVDAMQGIIGLSQFAFAIISAIVFLIWIYRAYKNLASFNTYFLRFTPGWAVGWFFVPIMSLFRPYQVVSEIWADSASGLVEDAYVKRISDSIIGWWWAFFIIYNYLQRVPYWLEFSNTPSNLLIAQYISMVCDAVGIVGIIITIMMVQNVTKLQEIKSKFINNKTSSEEEITISNQV